MTEAPYPREAFAADSGVSRETLARLERYAAMLVAMQATMNLVAPSTLDDLWRRHMLDSWQLVPLFPEEARRFVDIGSGAGFPGLVIAIWLRAANRPRAEVHLYESTQKKAAFLQSVSDALDLPAVIHATRAEEARQPAADVVTARACAPLVKLLGYAQPFWGPHTVGFFPKGQRVGEELTEASTSWKIDAIPIPSRSDPSGTILQVKGFARVAHRSPGHPPGRSGSRPGSRPQRPR